MTTGNHNNLCGGGSAGAWPPQTPKGARRQRVVGYVRVAAASQTGTESSLDPQAARLRAAAQAEGLELAEIITDCGESAHNLRRPGLQRLLAAIDACQLQAVMVADLHRLARQVGDLGDLLDRFARRGVAVVTDAGPLDPSTILERSGSRKH